MAVGKTVRSSGLTPDGDQARCAHRSATIEHDDCLVPRRTVRCPTREGTAAAGKPKPAQNNAITTRFRAAGQGDGHFPLS